MINGDTDLLASWPTIEVVLGAHSGGTISTQWHAYTWLYRDGPDGSNTWCFGFDDNYGHSGSVLGATWMKDHQIIFDLSSSPSKMGVVDANCPEYRTEKRPSVTMNGEYPPIPSSSGTFFFV